VCSMVALVRKHYFTYFGTVLLHKHAGIKFVLSETMF
jgi:hypothetical protein